MDAGLVARLEGKSFAGKVDWATEKVDFLIDLFYNRPEGLRWLRVFMLEFIGLGEAFQKRLWCADVFWKHSEARLKQVFFFRKERIRNMEIMFLCRFFGLVSWHTRQWQYWASWGELIWKSEHLFDFYTWLLWFIHLTVDKPYVSLCEHVRHKLGHVETAFLPCQDSLAAVEFGNTLAKEFSGPWVWWVVGWLDEKVLSLFFFLIFSFFFVYDLFFQKWWVESGQHSKEFRPEFRLVNQYK